MTKTRKTWLGVFTFMPLICVLIYFIFFVLMFVNIAQFEDISSGQPPSIFFSSFGLMALMIMLSVVMSISLMIYYIMHAYKNPKFSDNQRLIWVVIIVLAGSIGSIIYYFMEILPLPSEQASDT